MKKYDKFAPIGGFEMNLMFTGPKKMDVKITQGKISSSDREPIQVP